MPQAGLVERAWIDVELIGARIVRPDLRAAGRTEISPPVLRACEDIDLSGDRHRIDREDGVETERRAVQLPAGQAVAYADAIGLSPRLDPHLAASTAAFMDAI